MPVNKYNVGKLAERIVMNELEYHGYGATDLNKDRLAPNTDVIAIKGKKAWQIQVRGATNTPNENWWIQFGFCNDDTISGKSKFFNQKQSMYRADYVALVAVKSPRNYRCFVLPIAQAEKLAQLNLDRYYRRPKKAGGVRKPGKMWVEVEPRAKEKGAATKDKRREREILKKWENAWRLS